jgi:hypothetical protein
MKTTTSRTARLGSLACLSLLLLPAAGFAADPAALLARAKAATGGAAWDAVRTLHVRMRVASAGLTGTAEAWVDVRTGRHFDSYSLGPVQGAEGFDGKTAWSQDASGQTRVDDSGDGREGSADEAYRGALAYWYPERHPATLADAGDRTEGSRTFHRVRITPEGGRPFEVWIDARTDRIDRTVEKAAGETRTVFFSDYRQVGGLWHPFTSRSTNGEAQYDETLDVDSVEVNAPIDEAKFQRPEGKTHDFAIAAGKTAATLPFRLLNNHIYVDARLDGKPVQMLFDSGGANILTPAAAARLGLKAEGALQMRGAGEGSESSGLVKTRELALGDITLRDQLFLVAPLGGLAEVEGMEVDGVVGFEVLKRFVTRVGYAQRQLTFTLPEAFQAAAAGTPVPFTFDDQTPQVDGEIDGVAGKLTIDTGSRASLTINAPFAAAHGFQAKYAPRVEAMSGWGVGGGVRSRMTRAGLLKLGTVQVTAPVMDIALSEKGAFANPYLAGNVGGGVLQRFDVTFDYGRQLLFLAPNERAAVPDPWDRAGMWINGGGKGFQVKDVVAGSPAAEAGLRAGDVVMAVDGQDAGSLLLPDVRNRLKGELGTRVRLTLRSGAEPHEVREVTLVLRDLV